MKKIISILVLAAMMLSTVLAVIPVSAAEKGTASKTYTVNWKSLYEGNNLRSQWCYDTTEKQNDYKEHFNINATETEFSSSQKGDGDARSIYSTLMFDITADTYYQYEFEAKNNSGSNAGVIFAYATNPNAYTQGKDDWDAAAEGSKTAPYCLQGVFQNSADIGAADKGVKLSVFFGRDNHDKYKLPVSSSNNATTVTGVAAQNADGYVKYKVVYNGLNVTVLYNSNTNPELYLTAYEITLPEGAKIAFGVFGRDNNTVSIRNCKVTSYNASADAAMAKSLLAFAIPAAKAEAAKTDYTVGTKGALNIAITNAEDLLRNTSTTLTATDYDNAKTAIDTAIAGLKKKANKATLEKYISSTDHLELTEYTTASVEAFNIALAAANTANEDTEIDQADVDKAAEDLWNAMLGLTKKGTVNRNFLDKAIDEFASFVEADYTAYSWSAYKTAYDTAVALRDDTANDPKAEDFNGDTDAFDAAVAARQASVDAAISSLNNAKNALVNAKALNTIIGKAEALVETDYTADSWTTADIATKLASAKDAATNVETVKTQGEVDAIVTELTDAIASLKKLANFTELKALVAKAEALNKREYVGDAASINDALNAAKAAIADAEAETPSKVYLQDEVDVLKTALETAMNNLIPRRQNVLYMGEKASENNYKGIGNVFYYDYPEYIAEKGHTPGVEFPAGKDLDTVDDEGNPDYVLRFGTINGSKTTHAGDGNLLSSDFAHDRKDVTINGTTYGHAFGFSFYKAPTVDKITFHLPTNSDIASIDIYGAVTTKDGEKTLYGKVSSAEATAGDKEAPRFYMGTVTVPAATAGAQSIVVSGDLEAYKVEYIFFALKFKDGTSGYYKMYEIELYGIYNEVMNGIDIAAADFSALKAQYADYKARVKDDYTEASWAKLVEALAKTDIVNKNALSTAEEIAAAAETLKTALAQLELKPVDKTKLKEAIAAAKAKTNDDYTPKTWEALQNAITAADAIDTSTEKLQQSAIDAATKALNDAIAGLRTRGDTTKLKEALAKVKELKEEYFQGSAVAWNMLMAAVKQGEALLDDPNADQETIDKVTDDISYRQGNLLLTPGMSWPPEEEPEESESDTSDATEEETTPTEEDGGCGGCGSSAAISAVALVSVLGTAVALKKKED